MKKFLALGVIFLGLTAAKAQHTEKVEVTKTVTPDQAVHNVLHPNSKQHSGYKIKKKTRHGKKYVKKVDYNGNTVKVKTKHAGDIDKKVVEKPIK